MCLNTKLFNNNQSYGVDQAQSIFDLNLDLNVSIHFLSNLNTELETTNSLISIESIETSGDQTQEPAFEEFIMCDKKFPRSFSQAGNSPFVVLIGETECNWHIPIIFLLNLTFKDNR